MTVPPPEDETGRLALLEHVLTDLSRLISAEEVGRIVVERGRAAVGAVSAGVCLVEGDMLRTVASEGFPPDLRDEFELVPLSLELPMTDAARTGEAVWLPGAEATDDRYPHMVDARRRAGSGAQCALPLVAEERVLGALVIGLAEEREFSPADKLVLGVLARACGQALLRSELLHGERAARASAEDANALLDTIIETAPEGFALLDKDLRYVRVNQALARLNGVPAEDHIGRTVEEVLDDVPDWYVETIRGVLERGEPLVDLEVTAATPSDPAREHTWLVSYYPVPGADGEVVALGAFLVDITQRKRIERRNELLAELGAILDEVIGVEQRLERLARTLIGRLGDTCSVAIRGTDGSEERVAVAHVDPDAEVAIAGVQTAPGGAPEPQLPGIESAMIVPMVVGSRRIGHIAIGSTRPDAFDSEDRALAEEVARRAATAVDNAQLYESERIARERTARLQGVTAALSEALSPADVANAILQEAMPAAGASLGGVWQISEDGRALEAIAHVGYEDPAQRWTRVPLDSALPLPDCVRARRAIWLGHPQAKAAAYPELVPLMEATPSKALALIPLIVGGEPVGAIFMSFLRPQPFDEEQRAFITSMASQCAQALERARLFETERRVAVTLQRSLLPERLPRVEGVELAVTYQPAAGLEAGGDFYEAIRLPDGSLGLAVGDVVGRGAGAAAVMGQLRSALRAYALGGDPPGIVLARLSAFAETVAGALASTAVYAVLDPVSRTLRYACAGHPWPLVGDPSGEPSYLTGGRSVPLGTLQAPRYTEAVAELPAGATLLLYTDGLTERRGTDIDASLARLRECFGEHHDAGLSELLRRVLRMAEADGPDRPDDVALLAVRLATAAAVPLAYSFRADPRAIGGARERLAAWLGRLGASDEVLTDVLLAAGEALANAVEHAYAEQPAGPVELEASATATGEMTVTVRDFGRWRAGGQASDRGRGFALMRSVMDSVDVDRTPGGGSEVRLHCHLHGEPVPIAPSAPEGGSPKSPGAHVVALEGDLDIATAEAGRARLLDEAPRAGSALTVDLTSVAYLDSTGARMLVEVARHLGSPLTVVAPAGSPARRLLELSGLDAVLSLQASIAS